MLSRSSVPRCLSGLLFVLFLLAVTDPRAEAAEGAGSDVAWAYDKGFKAATADGRFKLGLGGWTQMMWTGAYQDEITKNEFNLRRARFTVRGTAYRDLHVVVNMELVRSLPFVDYFVTWQPMKAFGIRAGQFKAPISRQFLLAPFKRAFVSSALAMSKFHLSRDVGVAALGSFADKLLVYQVAAFNGTKMANKQDNTDLQFAGRLETHPLGPVPDVEQAFNPAPKPLFSIGVAGAFNPLEASAVGDDGEEIQIHAEQTTLEADLTFLWQRFFATGEFFYRMTSPETGAGVDSWGWYGQSGYFLLPRSLEVVARGSMWRPNTDATDNDNWEASGGLNWFLHGYAAQLQAEYSYLLDMVPGGDDKVGHQVRLQLVFKF